MHPKTHPVSEYEFEVIIGGDGRRNTLEGTGFGLFSLAWLITETTALRTCMYAPQSVPERDISHRTLRDKLCLEVSVPQLLVYA